MLKKIFLLVITLSILMPKEALCLRPLSTRILQEDQLIQAFEEGLKDKLTEFIAAAEPENEQLKEEIIELLISNLDGVNGGIGIVNMTTPGAQEWRNAALSYEDVMNMLKRISGIDRRWDHLLDFANTLPRRKNAIYGDMTTYSHRGNEADFYHTSTSLLLDSILTNGILPLDVVRERGLDFQIASKSPGQGVDPDVVALSFDFYECLVFQMATSNRLAGYQVVFGVSEIGTKRTFVRGEKSLADRNEPSERQVRNVDINDVTHIYVPAIVVEEIKQKLQRKGIGWIQVVAMQPCKDEPSSQLCLLNPEQRIQRLLIVDDVQVVITNLQAALSQVGLDIQTEYDAFDALERIKAQAGDKDIDSLFDLIITDKDMPLMQGDRFIDELRALGYRGPIVLMTLRPCDLEESGFIEKRNHPTHNSESNYWHFELTAKGIRTFGPNTIVLSKIESSYRVFPQRVRRIVTLLNEGKTVTKNDIESEGTSYANLTFALQAVDELLQEKWDSEVVNEIVSACLDNQELARQVLRKITEYSKSQKNSFNVRQGAANLMECLTRASVPSATEPEVVVRFVRNIIDLDTFELEGRKYCVPSFSMSILDNAIMYNPHCIKDSSIQQLILSMETTVTDLKQVDQSRVNESIGTSIRSCCIHYDHSFHRYVESAKEDRRQGGSGLRANSAGRTKKAERHILQSA